MKKITKKDVDHRLAIALGHLKKVREMVTKDEYCIDVLQQSMAVQSALRKIDELVLQNHLETCVSDALRSAQGKLGSKRKDKAINEIVEVFKKGRR